MTIRSRVPAALLTLAVTIFQVGCDSEHTICGTDPSVAFLAGHVHTGTDPVGCTLEARGVDLPDGVARLIQGNPQADGTYELAVPPGRYTLMLDIPEGASHYYYSHAGPVTYSLLDTLTVESGRTCGELDFDLGTLQVEITLSDPNLAGTRAEFELHRQNPDGQGWIESFHGHSAEMTAEGATLRAAGILPGLYQVELEIGASARYSDHHAGERVWLPDADGPDQAAWYSVTAGTMQALSFTVSDSSAHLAGRIGGAWLELGLEELPRLSVVDEDSNLVIESWQVSDDGSFALNLLRPRPVRLLINQNGVTQYIGGPDFASATVYSPAPRETIDGIEVTTCAIILDLAASWSGRYNQPRFEVFTENGSTLLAAVRGSLVNAATFALPNLWPGKFLIRVMPDAGAYGWVPWLDQWYPGVLELDQAQPVTLAEAGRILPLEMGLLEGGSISGRILGTLEPNRYRTIIVTTADDIEPWGFTYIWDPDMAYSIIGLPDGLYRIGQGSSRQATDTIWYPGTTDWDAAEIIAIENAGAVENIDIPLE